ncbi:MAG: hypothetical protein LJE84_05470 [Gammaproteobacteria bacterium]|jgi:hypothetical protein|nr:hypothetical protein [Gammaproteobacteria bacterium]
MRESPPSWDDFSDQPHRLPGAAKGRWQPARLRELATIGATVLAQAPGLAWRYARLRPGTPRAAREMLGLGIGPGHRRETLAMLDELGVHHVLVRVPVATPREELPAYQALLEQLGDRRVLVNCLQDRSLVREPAAWAGGLRRIFAALGPRADAFQIGNAVNRTKWGCQHTGEYLALLEQAQGLREEFPDLVLAGSSVIDFEPHYTLRTLRNRRRYRLDAVSALLYVNRRGAPEGRQFGHFDLQHKLRLLKAITAGASRAADRLWITEFNWPLVDTKPWTPNSGRPETSVDEAAQAEYLRRYVLTCSRSGWVERAYWWQLIAPGYGLVDSRDGLRKRPAYEVFRSLCAEAA